MTFSDHNPQVRSSIHLVMVGMLMNTVLALIKLAAGVVGHSHALIADAVESLMDVFGSMIVWGGLRIAAAPPDETHPYGHGRAETIATMIVAMILGAAGVSIAISSVREILAPQRPPAVYTLFVLLAVVAIKELLYQAGRRLSERSGSGAVLADALHHRSDAITSAAAAIGISVALLGGPGFERADGIAALFASFIILFNAGRLLRGPLHELMDTRSPEIIAQVRAVARRVAGVKDVEKIHSRKSGTQFLVDLHLEVDPAMSVRDAHAIAHQVKDAVRQHMPQVLDVLIHIEPHEPGNRSQPPRIDAGR